ncbi:hypothetical protein [Lentzea sp. NBRC 102530]|uniref:hypothetical protein n=1 Tax=Lentzea sp. NBRC 102530 TaxID=3032201 RepID=UPI0024A5EC33|nr:hypothetical protein [Lentzea sp. NBRC 102530]GLY51772.1 hypothetical protein Lesp01_54280 [Lentzea sp. NBRC 102530]
MCLRLNNHCITPIGPFALTSTWQTYQALKSPVSATGCCRSHRELLPLSPKSSSSSRLV